MIKKRDFVRELNFKRKRKKFIYLNLSLVDLTFHKKVNKHDDHHRHDQHHTCKLHL